MNHRITDRSRVVATALAVLAFAGCGGGGAPERLLSAEQAVTSGPVRGASGGGGADIPPGKPAFSEYVANSVVSNRLFFPHSVIVDRSTTPNRMFVFDGGNSRVLGISDIGRCVAQAGGCVVDASQGDIVIGQPGFTTSACNGDSGYQLFPVRARASAATLCSEPENQLSVGEGSTGSSMYVDQTSGDLYVTDMFNHRVLRYIKPFTTDRVADDVWGQADFTGVDCNHGATAADDHSLCFGWSEGNNWTAGVDVDAAGNLWVADSSNNRVLRFPAGAHTANLVLGQPGFTTRTPGAGLNQLRSPAAVRVTATGAVYVADYLNDRVLVFDAPATGGNGRVFAPAASFSHPEGLDFDPTQSGGIWIAQRTAHDVELWDMTSAQLVRTLGQRNNGNILNNASGSLGIDANGNYYLAVPQGDLANSVVRFPASGPYLSPSTRLFSTNGVQNSRDARGMGNGYGGMAVYQDATSSQLITADVRILFWNGLGALSNGKAADGVAGQAASTFANASPGGAITAMKASKAHLYVAREFDNHGLPPRIEVYDLPLTNGQQPRAAYLTYPFSLNGGGQLSYDLTVNYGTAFWGLAVADDDSALWVSHGDTSRVFRVRNPLSTDQVGAPTVVDVVLGQPNSTSTAAGCVAFGQQIGPTLLCHNGSLALDRLGNLWVSDQSLETRGSARLLEFNAAVLSSGTGVVYAPAATRVLPNLATWEPAFDSNNRMVVGYNPYFTGNTAANPDGGYFMGTYLNPLGAGTLPSDHLKDYFSMAFAATFDASNNLYVEDIDRSRILVYKRPLATTASLTANGLVHPTDAALVSGQVWVANLDGGSVSRFGPDGSAAGAPLTGFDTPIGIAVVGSQVWVASNGGNRIHRRTLGGDIAAPDLTGNGLLHPTGIALVGSQVWVANTGTNSVVRFDANGVPLPALTDAAINNPRDILVVGSQVWLANAAANNVLRYNFDGSSAGAPIATSTFNAPIGLAVVGANVWVTNGNTAKITILNTSGMVVDTRSDNGMSYPWGVLAVSGSAPPVWVMNQASSSISRFVP